MVQNYTPYKHIALRHKISPLQLLASRHLPYQASAAIPLHNSQRLRQTRRLKPRLALPTARPRFLYRRSSPPVLLDTAKRLQQRLPQVLEAQDMEDGTAPMHLHRCSNLALLQRNAHVIVSGVLPFRVADKSLPIAKGLVFLEDVIGVRVEMEDRHEGHLEAEDCLGDAD